MSQAYCRYTEIPHTQECAALATSWALVPSEIGTLTLPLCDSHAHVVGKLAAYFRLVAVPAQPGEKAFLL